MAEVSEVRRAERRAKAEATWERDARRFSDFMPRYDSPAWVAAEKALSAEREYRDATGQRCDRSQEVGVTVHAALDAAAAYLLAIAPAEYAEATAWAAAALRCQIAAPCPGCPSCQTVTAPTRPNVEIKRWR